MTATVTAQELLSTLEAAFAAGAQRPAPIFEVHGAVPPLGPALAAHVARTAKRLVVYVVPEEEQTAARKAAFEFFLGGDPGDDPLAPPPVMDLPAFDSSPYAEVQPDRRTTMRRLALLYRLGHGLAPTVLVASAASLFRRVL